MNKLKEYYVEYPIRCKSCNENIACRVEEYQQLIDVGYSIEDSLNEMGVMNTCSRNSFQNPTYVFFDMEYRPLIEGRMGVESVQVDELEFGVHRVDTTSYSVPFKNKDLDIPDNVGLPTINENPNDIRESVPLMPGVNLDILNGRTYLTY